MEFIGEGLCEACPKLTWSVRVGEARYLICSSLEYRKANCYEKFLSLGGEKVRLLL